MDNKKINIGVIMDDINNINPEKDTTLELLLEAKKRSLNIIYFEQNGLYIKNGLAYGKGYEIEVFPRSKKYFEYIKSWEEELSKLDMLLMRKDHPFNMAYIYTTYILDLAEKNGVKVINKTKSLRDINEKSYTAWIPDLTPAHIITNNINQIKNFLKQYKKIVIKPLDSMGGQSIFVIDEKDLNTNVIIEVMTKNNNRFVIAQKYIKEITKGDKRIIIINGEPIKYSLVRIPKEGDTRGNLAMGSSKKISKLTKKELEICSYIGALLINKGIYLAGIDVIGEYITEINITSPTGAKEIKAGANIDVAKIFFDEVLKII